MRILFLIIVSLVLVTGVTPITLLLLSRKTGSTDGLLRKAIFWSAVFIGVMVTLIIVARFLSFELVRIGYQIMGVAVVGFMLATLYRVIFLVLKLFGYHSIMVSLPAWWSFVVLWIGTTILGFRNFLKPVTVKEITLTSPHVVDAVRFVYFADTQLGSTSVKHLNRVVNTINSLNPEFITFGGDLVDYDYYKQEDFDIFQTLQVPLYYITGNHEYYHDAPRVLDYLKKYPRIRVLDNEKATPIPGVEVIGVDYRNFINQATYENTLDELAPDDQKFSVFLYHEPKRVESTAVRGYNLQLYGHTHGGQLYPGPWIVRAVYGAYAFGLSLIEKSTTRVYTTTGAGLFGPNIRLGTQNEIVLFTIQPE